MKRLWAFNNDKAHPAELPRYGANAIGHALSGKQGAVERALTDLVTSGAILGVPSHGHVTDPRHALIEVLHHSISIASAHRSSGDLPSMNPTSVGPSSCPQLP